MKQIALILALALSTLTANAQNVTFGTVSTENKKAFQSYWKLRDEDMKKYQSYMEVAGRFRHTQSNPLVVLSIISDDPEDKGYYAAKAAKYESDMSQREITAAWLLSNEMEKQGLVEAMEQFSADLTGVETAQYLPKNLKKDWQKGDLFVLVIDDVCRQINCLKQFTKKMNAIPKHIEKHILLKQLKAQYDKKALEALTKQFSKIKIKRFDAIEHGNMSSLKNQAGQVRDNQLLRKL